MYKDLLRVRVYQGGEGEVHWIITVEGHAKALGLHLGGGHGDVLTLEPETGADADPADVSVAFEIVASRLNRLADSTSWSHNLF